MARRKLTMGMRKEITQGVMAKRLEEEQNAFAPKVADAFALLYYATFSAREIQLMKDNAYMFRSASYVRIPDYVEITKDDGVIKKYGDLAPMEIMTKNPENLEYWKTNDWQTKKGFGYRWNLNYYDVESVLLPAFVQNSIVIDILKRLAEVSNWDMTVVEHHIKNFKDLVKESKNTLKKLRKENRLLKDFLKSRVYVDDLLEDFPEWAIYIDKFINPPSVPARNILPTTDIRKMFIKEDE